jgi:hypothetical protein
MKRRLLVPKAPATTLPFLGNMAYYGGHVPVTPKEHLVFCGLGQAGAVPASQTLETEHLAEGSITAALRCDPDGAGKYIADFVSQLGGTGWAGVRTQYYQTNPAGTNQSITNPARQLAGICEGFSTVLGHEIEETVTDPGAEDVIGSGTSAKQIGGWYDAFDANENGDKCAWVGESLLTAQGPPAPIPGATGDITGNRGTTFAVQSLWSNDAAAVAGYCAGAGTDLPTG